jgi:hypothetical protein
MRTSNIVIMIAIIYLSVGFVEGSYNNPTGFLENVAWGIAHKQDLRGVGHPSTRIPQYHELIKGPYNFPNTIAFTPRFP